MPGHRTRIRNCGRIALLAALLAACQPGEDAEPTASAVARRLPVVFTVSYPLAWMADRIGGEAIEVVFPAPDDVDPAHWQPTPETILNYQGADLVLLNGAGYAAWVQFAALSPGKLVDTSRGLSARLIPAGEATHSHGPGGAHDHRNVASHTWLDPIFAAAQAKAIASALEVHVPNAPAGLERLQADLAHLDARLSAVFRGWSDAGVLYSHPVYQYLDARYGLAGWSVSWEPDEHPSDAEWQRLAERLRNQRASVMLWEGEPSPATTAKLRELGITPVVFETGAWTPAQGDYLTLMQQNIERLTEARIDGGNEHHP